MAQSPQQPRDRGGDFISKIVKDPKNPPQTQQVAGYVGAAGEAGRTRIYLDTSLQNYVEVPEDKVLHIEPIPEHALGLSMIWLAADAQIFTPAQPRVDARGYFGGAIYQDYLGQGAAAAGEAALPQTIAVYCRATMHVPCISYVDYCTLLGRCTASPGCHAPNTVPAAGCRQPFDQPAAHMAAATPQYTPITRSELTCPTFIACTRVAPLCHPSVLGHCPNPGHGGLPNARQAAIEPYTHTARCPGGLHTLQAPYCTYYCATFEPAACPSVFPPCFGRPIPSPPETATQYPIYCGGPRPMYDPYGRYHGS